MAYELPNFQDVPRAVELLEGLNDKQQEAVQALSGAVLVKAGPGSGKTRVLTHRAAALVALGVEPWRILAVTFTNKAAGEMRTRIEALVGEEAALEMWVMTFHSMCARILRVNYALAGLPRGFSIADADDAKAIMRKVLVEGGVEATGKLVTFASKEISLAKNNLIGPNKMATSSDPRVRKLAPFFEAYNVRLRQAGLVDFDDLMVKTLEILVNNPDVAEKYQRRFRYIMIDEYQDTNVPQHRLVNLLAKGHGNLFVVGDKEQSIYIFRGAGPEAFMDFKIEYEEAKVIELAQNYRSTKKIVEVSKALLAAGEAKGQLINLWTDNPEGSPVRLKSFEEADDEAAWVVGEIKAGIKDGTPAGEFAVLYRTNMQSNLLEKALRAAALPYRLVGALRFYERAEIKDVMSYLRIIANPNDELSLARCSGVPRRGIGPTALEAARNNFMARLESGQVVTLVESIRLDIEEGAIKRALAGWQRLLADLDAVELAAMEGPAAAVRAVKGLPGFADAILSKGGEAPEERLGNVDELVSDAAEFERDIPLSVDMEAIREALGDRVELAELVGFLEQVALVTDVESGDGEGGVWLMTAHASKGKEFANVFVVGLEDGLFPHERAEGKEGVEEERRLAFVAFSRAEKTLTLTHSERRMVAGEFQDRRSSPFLKALPTTVQRLARSESTRFSGPDIPRRDRTDAWGSRDIYKSKIFTPTRSFTPVRKAVPKVEIGNTVEHKVFGEGVVTSKNGTTATVQFADRSRLLDLTLAPITVID